MSVYTAGKESACNAGDSSLIPGLGRYPGKGIGYPLQYSWASLVSQMVKNPPPMWETWVWSLGWEQPLEKGTMTHSSILAWRIPWTEEPSRLRSMGSQGVRHNRLTFTFTHYIYIYICVCMKESEVAQSCPTLCDPMDCSPPGSSIHGVF